MYDVHEYVCICVSMHVCVCVCVGREEGMSELPGSRHHDVTSLILTGSVCLRFSGTCGILFVVRK